jgi:hypothetical protein
MEEVLFMLYSLYNINQIDNLGTQAFKRGKQMYPELCVHPYTVLTGVNMLFSILTITKVAWQMDLHFRVWIRETVDDDDYWMCTFERR